MKGWMRLIVVKINEERITITGHARYAEEGKDIVCAAVSVLAQTLIRSIEWLTKDDISYSFGNGIADMRFKNLSEISKKLVDSFFIGICMIANQYPENVTIG
ncbi:ribosomal-processing cysteine protease Prp [Blautia producta]|uniref:ribosomal-processing cysteine protease Prp n=1 Tax=Blautia producta TaxID=33035 RepID=UPI0031B64B9D